MVPRPATILLAGLWVVASATLGILVVALGYEFFAWQDRHSELQDRARLVVARAEQIATDSRIALRAMARLKTVPCSPEDLAELRIIAARTTQLVDIGRLHDGKVLCDGARGIGRGTLLPPNAIRRADGGLFWSQVQLFGDPRVHVAALARDGAVVFSRPRAASELLDDLERAVVAARTKAGDLIFRRSGAPERLVGAEYARSDYTGFWQEHGIRSCATISDFCIEIDEPAPVALGRMGAGTMAAVFAGGSVLGLGGLSLAWSRNSARRSLSRRLARAIRRDQIHVEYQPIVRLGDRQLVGFEALARWHQPAGGAIPPDIFIPVAERDGLLPALTERVMARAIAGLAPLLADGTDIYLSINVGVGSLFDPELPELLDYHCLRNGIDRSRIALEITERDTGDIDRIGEAIRSLREAGYRVFLDDFGTGYSSLAYLATLPIDTIKLDKLFTRSVDSAFVSTMVLRQVSHMVATLGLTIVFEGVETEEQAQSLEQLTPDAVGQGWLFGRPMPAHEALSFPFA